MQDVNVLVTPPEYEGRQKYLDQMAAVSPRLKIEQRACNSFEETADSLADVEVLLAYKIPAHLKKANRLRWVQLHYSGIDHVSWSPVFDEDRQITVTNVAGAHAVAIAEYCITTMGMLSRGFLQLFHDQLSRTWIWARTPPTELWGSTVGIVGYGHIGRELARLATCHNIRVLAVKRNPEQRSNSGYHWAGVGDPEGLLPDRLMGLESLDELLRESDFVVNCLPHTPTTRNLFGQREFSLMKKSAFFINVGRGETVDDIALARALREGVLSGAALDAFATDPDPLPKDNPLWELENVFISPHISGTRRNEQYLERTTELFCENLRRYISDEPLLNIVTRAKGY